MSRNPRAVALGLVALLVAGLAIGATGLFLAGGLRGGLPVTAVFSAPGIGQQLPVGGDVKVRGVLVGYIGGIELRGEEVAVELRLDPGVDLPSDVRAEIRSKTAFGEKWIELLPDPASSAPPLVAGSEIPDDATIEPLELERELQLGHELLSEISFPDLADFFAALAEGFVGQEADARRALDRGLVALRALDRERLDLGLRQLAEFSTWLDDNDDALLSLLGSLDEANRALVGAAPEFRSNLQSVPVFLNEFASFQERTEQSLGRLVEDGAAVAEILAARTDSLTDLVVQLEPFLTVWNSGLRQPCAGEFESDMTCWQVYQMPGLGSRGLYGAGQAPDENDPGDPRRALGRSTSRAFADLFATGRLGPIPASLAEILYWPTRSSFYAAGGGAP